MVVIVSGYNATGTRFKFDPEIETNHKVYAQKHGYIHDSECTQKIPWPYDLISPNVFGKVYKIWNCLDKYKHKHDIFWIDGDAIFANMSLKIPRKTGCSLVAGIDRGLKQEGFNAGVFLLRNDGISRQILMYAHEHRHKYKHLFLPEQEALNDICMQNPDWCCIVPARKMQSIVRLREYQEKDFIAHFTFFKNIVQKQIIMEYAKKQYSQNS